MGVRMIDGRGRGGILSFFILSYTPYFELLRACARKKELQKMGAENKRRSRSRLARAREHARHTLRGKLSS